MFSAERPQNALQFVFSLTRMVLLAYIIVMLGEFRLSETGVVILGFLSYKGAIVMEMLEQARPAFTFQAFRPEQRPAKN